MAENTLPSPYSFWKAFWNRFKGHRLGMLALYVVILFVIVGVYAPFLASSKPIVVYYDGSWYFPLFRYLFFAGFYTKRLDIFFNLLMFTLPVMICILYAVKRFKWQLIALMLAIQFLLFFHYAFYQMNDPASSIELSRDRQAAIRAQMLANADPANVPKPLPSSNWDFELAHMTPYAKLNMLVQYKLLKEQHIRLLQFAPAYEKREIQRWLTSALEQKKAELRKKGVDPLPSDADLKKQLMNELTPKMRDANFEIPTLWSQQQLRETQQIKRLKKEVEKQQAPFDALMQDPANLKDPAKRSQIQAFVDKQANLNYLKDRQKWLKNQSAQLKYMVMPFISHFHWEDDAGGKQSFNQLIDWWDLTRINRKDLAAALIFGVRISIVVGIISVFLALLIGIPIGAFSGFYGGTLDIITLRLVEIWESMPTFFMLLLVVAMLQSKSIFIVISVIGIFGWTGFARYIRGEFFKQRNLPYVEACKSLGFNDSYVIFKHILPNAIPPLLTLMPFAIMGAISSEAGLSFLGLGEEGSCSWGVLMDEGRSAFPAESYLLWPPAILLTILLMAIALVGDALRDSLDPKLSRS